MDATKANGWTDCLLRTSCKPKPARGLPPGAHCEAMTGRVRTPALLPAVLLALLAVVSGGRRSAAARWSEDPAPAIYPGQANVALLAPLRTSENGTGKPCDVLSPRLVRLALAGIWAAQQANFRKAPTDFNIGVYLYDTCDKDQVALRQSFRAVQQAGHVRSMACPNTRVPPIFGAILYGDARVMETTAKTFASFSIPAVAASDLYSEGVPHLADVYSTAPSAVSLARALGSMLRRLGWTRVAVASSPSTRPSELSAAFRSVSKDTEIDTVVSDDPPGSSFTQVQQALGTTKHLTEAGCRAAVLFLSPAEAKTFLSTYEPDPDAAFSWILATAVDLSSSLPTFLSEQKLRRLRHVLLVSPSESPTTEFQDYVQDLLDRDGTGATPLLQELRKTYARNEVVQDWEKDDSGGDEAAAVIRAVWAMAAALRAVQRVQCGRGTDCLFGGRLSTSVLDSLKSLDHSMVGAGVASLEGTPLHFSMDKRLASLRYTVKAVSTSGEVLEIGRYTERSGLEVDEMLVPSRTTPRDAGASRPSTSLRPSSRERSSNLRSSNLEIQNDPEPQNLGESSNVPTPSPASSEENDGENSPSTSPDAVRLSQPKLFTVWIAKPWSLTIVVAAGLGILLSAYVAVFLLMKLCEGVVRKGHQLTSLLLLLSVVGLFLAGLLFTFRPRPRLCAAQQLAHHTSYAFAFGCLLLKGMHLNAMQSAGLGGRASGLNQFLTICFLVAVQLAVEAQAWMLAPPGACQLNQARFLLHQLYPCLVLALAVLMAFRTRNSAYHRRDARSLLCTSLLAVPVLAAGHTAFLLLAQGEPQVAALGFSLVTTGFLLLVGIFAPYLRALHKRGGYAHKPLGYSDSSASAFTSFQRKDVVPDCCYLQGRAVTLLQPGRLPTHRVRNPLYLPGSAYP